MRTKEGDDMKNPYELSDDVPVYVISVAASLSGMHPQTLRGYERVGLVTPRRTAGGGRRYSMRGILALRGRARLPGMHPQTLRGYERGGLVPPRPPAGGGRRYSMRDILALREIQ